MGIPKSIMESEIEKHIARGSMCALEANSRQFATVDVRVHLENARNIEESGNQELDVWGLVVTLRSPEVEVGDPIFQ